MPLQGSFELRGSSIHIIPNRPSTLIGVAHDRPVVGYGGQCVNTLRLWAATAPKTFDFAEFSHGDFVGAVIGNVAAESLTRVLYPDDSTEAGRTLRFLQEYFLVSCSLQDILSRFRKQEGNSWAVLPEHVAIQLNDTHPSLAVAELMRILLDQEGLDWDTAWTITVDTLAYTNHTLLPEALEKWPVDLFERLVPRLLAIVYEINERFLGHVSDRYPGDQDRLPAHERDRGAAGPHGPHGASRRGRYAQHERGGRDSLRPAADARAEGLRRDVPGAIQQQDQRRHAAALAADGQSALWPR